MRERKHFRMRSEPCAFCHGFRVFLIFFRTLLGYLKDCNVAAHSVDSREIKFAVTWSYVKRQTAKMKLLPFVFSSLNSRVKIFVFVANSRRHFSMFV